MTKKLLRAFYCLILILCSYTSKSQTFNCYIANDHLVSATVYEFDEYIISTSTMFNLRSVQNCFIFNPAFVDPASVITVTLVPGSTQMNSYSVSTLNWSMAGSGFQTSSNTGGSCASGTLINNFNPVRIGTFRIESSLPFNCAPANPQMVIPGNASPSGLVLKMSISKWNTLDCSTGLTTGITANGTYTQYSPNTLYSNVQNMAPVISSQPNNASACNGGLVTFSVTAVANAGIATPVTYQWLENGVPISNGSTANGVYAGATTSSLTITNPGVSLAGHQFSCVVSQCNSDTTVSVVITASSNDNNACTVDACDPATGIVTNTPINIDDNNSCTTDACDPANGNVSHNVINTNDGDGCTTDGCDPLTGVFHTPVNTNDSDPCTADACDPATGSVTHTAVVTDDSNGCTIDGCDPLTGVYHTPVNTNDNNQCTIDACDAATGVISHTAIVTDDGNACTTDGCDVLTGVFHTPVTIDDGNACTFDHCNTNTGVINHVPLVTDDGNACTTDGCDVVTGVFHTPINISDGNSCTLDACDTVSGNVTHTNITSSSPALSVTNNCGYSTLTASGFTGSLLWSTGDSTPVINVTTGGVYSVTQSIFGCLSPPGIISASPIALPAVSLGNDTLVQANNYILNAGSGFLTYLWSTGATSQTVTVQSSGWYWVTVTNSNCSATDSVFVDFYLGITSSELQNAVSVYPNPGHGLFNVSFNRDLKNVRFEVYNVTGMKVYENSKSTLPANSITNINLEVSQGIYMLRVISSAGNVVQTIVVE